MKVLIAYATTEGHTRKIAETVTDQVSSLGHSAKLHDAMRKRETVHAGDHDAFIVAGSVHQERHQREIEAFVASCLKELSEKPSMFISVSLAAAFPEKAADAAKYISRFQSETGWKPDVSLTVAGAVKSEEYDYFQQQILEHVVLKDDLTHRAGQNQDFTNWQALSRVIESFITDVN